MRLIWVYGIVIFTVAGCGLLEQMQVMPVTVGCDASAGLIEGGEPETRLIVSEDDCVATVIPAGWEMIDLFDQSFSGLADGFIVDQDAYRLHLYPGGFTERDVMQEIQLVLPTAAFIQALPAEELTAFQLAEMIHPVYMFETDEDVPLVSAFIGPVFGAALTTVFSQQDVQNLSTWVEELDLDVLAAGFYYLNDDGQRIGIQIVFEVSPGVFGVAHAIDMNGDADSLVPIVFEIVNQTVWQAG